MKKITPLEESIAHWKRMETGAQKKREEPYAENCALCVKYYKTEAEAIEGECIGCPVFERTRQTECKNTPYADCRNEYEAAGFSARFRKLAKLERLFLESLLPSPSANRKWKRCGACKGRISKHATSCHHCGANDEDE